MKRCGLCDDTFWNLFDATGSRNMEDIENTFP